MTDRPLSALLGFETRMMFIRPLAIVSVCLSPPLPPPLRHPEIAMWIIRGVVSRQSSTGHRSLISDFENDYYDLK